MTTIGQCHAWSLAMPESKSHDTWIYRHRRKHTVSACHIV
jgi:hypothetical protein